MTRNDPRRGVVLMTVLWSIALLAALAMAASVTFRGFAGVVVVDRYRVQSDALLTAGLEAAAGTILASDKTPLRDIEIEVALTTGSVRARLNDEGGRIDVGKAPVEMLAALVRLVGASPAAADRAARAIVELRGPPNGRVNATEQSIFDVQQLARIPGLRADWLAAMAPLTTSYGSATVNPLTAPRGVIEALPGIDGARLKSFLAERQSSRSGAERLMQILGTAQRYLAVKPQRVAGIDLTANLTDGYSASARVLIAVLPQDSEPYRVLSFTPIRAGQH